MTGRKVSFLFFLLFSFLALQGAGCEGTPPINDLHTPMGLECSSDNITWSDNCSLPTGNTVYIRFYAYNPERNLSGYNVYYSNTHNTWASFQALVASHITGETFDDSISSTYILDGTQPTINAATLTEIASRVTLIERSFPVPGGTNYYAITAVDITNVIESTASNLITITGS
jgi:hypothetical protein